MRMGFQDPTRMKRWHFQYDALEINSIPDTQHATLKKSIFAKKDGS